MDLKGLKWFGNVYQKFETMCLEVEEAVCQDTVKYVENQVQTDGASVKKFYSEVVDDLLSPSLMVNSLSCTVAHKKPKMGIKEEPKSQLFEDRNASTKKDKSQMYAPSFDRYANTADPAVLCNHVTSTTASKSAGVSTKKMNLVIKRKPKTVIQNLPEVPKATNPGASIPDKNTGTSIALTIENIQAPIDHIIEEQLEPDDGNGEDFKLKHIADASAKPVKIILTDSTCTCHLKDSVVSRSSENEEVFKSLNSADAVNDFTNIPPSDTSSGPNGTVTYEAIYSDADTKNKDEYDFSNSYSQEWTAQTGETDGWNIETITSEEKDDDDIVEAGTEIMHIKFKNHTLLEESCIIVDRENLPICSHKEPKHKSYKKKLREAFSSRGKTAVEKEYRQLAAQYESRSSLKLQQCGPSSSLFPLCERMHHTFQSFFCIAIAGRSSSPVTSLVRRMKILHVIFRSQASALHQIPLRSCRCQNH